MIKFQNKQILFLLLVIFSLSTSCQNQSKVKIQLFEANANPEAFNPVFWDTLRTSYWYNHHFYRFSGDTSVSAILSMDQKVLYVEIYNKQDNEYCYKKIFLDEKCNSIEHIFYHNNDSIFVLQHRHPKQLADTEWADILLLNGNGKLLRSYRLDDMPYIRKSNRKNRTLTVSRCCNQMVGHELVIWFDTYNPHISEPGFKNFNPPLAAAFDVRNGNIRMLNIRCPVSLVERRFTHSQSSMWIKKMDNDNLLVGFECCPFLYKYSINEDTMCLVECHYSTIFSNTDSASMEKGKNYTCYDFFEPDWLEGIHCYIRPIWISHYSGYRTIDRVTELMDSNFNHISYLVGNESYKTPVFYRGDFVAVNKMSNRSHIVSIKKQKKVPLQRMMDQVMEKLPVTEQDTIQLQKYLTSFGIQRKSIVFIINLKYPCGECLDYIFSMIREKRDLYVENKVYIVAYDPDKTGLLAALCKRNNLEDMENIIEDNLMLKNVYVGSESMEESQFFAIDFLLEDPAHIAVTPMGFADLKPFFERLNKKINK